MVPEDSEASSWYRSDIDRIGGKQMLMRDMGICFLLNLQETDEKKPRDAL